LPTRGQEGCEAAPFRPFVNDNATWDTEAAVASWLSEYLCCRFLSPDLCCVGMAETDMAYSQKIALCQASMAWACYNFCKSKPSVHANKFTTGMHNMFE
jgi:hypothetical protein